MSGVYCHDCWWEADMVETFLRGHDSILSRHIRMAPWKHAVFMGEPVAEVWVIAAGRKPIELPPFPCADRSVEELTARIKLLLPFA